MAEEKEGGTAVVAEGEKKKEETGSTVTNKKRKGIVSRIWNGLFRLHGDDFEKRLQYISKEEANVLKRMNRRAMNGRKRLRQLIYFSILAEMIAVGYAIMTTRTVDLDWRMRAIRVLPMFVLPALSSAIYSFFISLAKRWERKDQKLLEKLRAERQEKIDELKERTNYYTTQQLIQRYDPDPAAKAAAASVLASKLGAESGMKMYLEDETEQKMLTGKSKDAEYMQTSGLRNRKQANNRSSSVGSGSIQHAHSLEAEMLHGHEDVRMPGDKPLAVAHHDPQTPTANDGGWIARLAALLVGEDPTQSYALICGNCHMHNGLVRKEDFPFVTYFCPHCQVLNQPKQLSQRASGSSTPDLRRSGSTGSSTPELRRGGSIDTIPETPETVVPSTEEDRSEIEETTKRVASVEPDS